MGSSGGGSVNGLAGMALGAVNEQKSQEQENLASFGEGHGWMSTKDTDGNVTQHAPSVEGSYDRDYGGPSTEGPTAAATVKGALKSTNTVTSLSPQINMVSQLAQSILGLAPQTQWNYEAAPGLSTNPAPENNNTGNYGYGLDTPHNAGGSTRVTSAVSPTINEIPNQTSEATAKATTADNDFNPEEAAANAVEEERKKARQRVGLMQMRAIDPLFIENLPQIFRSRAY